MTKPTFHSLWTAFPDHAKYKSLRDLYSSLGGSCEKNIDAPGFGPNGNTCASRLSVAFNGSSAPINASVAAAAGAQTLRTSSGSRVIFRVSEFRKYLLLTLGKPLIDDTSPYNDAFHKRKGIIAFSVNWQGATGHIALWNGLSFREPSHDDYSTYANAAHPNVRTSRGEFWELT